MALRFYARQYIALTLIWSTGLAALPCLGQQASEPSSFAQLSPSQKLAVLQFRQKYLEASLRKAPEYGEIRTLCSQNKDFQTYVAKTQDYLRLGSHSFMDIFKLLEPDTALKLVGHNFLSEDIYDLLHSESFYLAIQDCSANVETRDAIITSLFATDVVGKTLGLWGFYRVSKLVLSKRVTAVASKFFKAIPILKPLLQVTAACVVAAQTYSIFELLSPKKRNLRDEEFRRQANALLAADREQLQNLIIITQSNEVRAETKLKSVPRGSPEYARWAEYIDEEKVSILNMQLAADGN